MTDAYPPSAKYEFLKETYASKIADLLVETMPKRYSAERDALEETLENLGFYDAFCALERLSEEEYYYQFQSDYERDLDYIFDAFAQMLNPSADRKNGKEWKYLHWICAQFLTYRHNGKPMLVEDFVKHRDNLQDFEVWSSHLHKDNKPNQIDDTRLAGGERSENGFKALESLLSPYQRQRAHKQELRKRRYQM